MPLLDYQLVLPDVINNISLIAMDICAEENRFLEFFRKFDIYTCRSVHRNIISNYSQQDATFLDLFIFTDALHVSGGSSAHHQEHITVRTDSGIVN